ncbi:hypothetical protein MMC11_000314 [Xylographa trunciseda]|nr:hypothetical protein [Xylographa trunciseda]
MTSGRVAMSVGRDNSAAAPPTSNNTGQGKNPAKRAACDRCRAQKLRCETEMFNGNLLCVRCQHAETRCHFSLPGTQGRPSRRRGSVWKAQLEAGNTHGCDSTAAQPASRQTLSLLSSSSSSSPPPLEDSPDRPQSRDGPHRAGPELVLNYIERQEKEIRSRPRASSPLTSAAFQPSSNERNIEDGHLTFPLSPPFCWAASASSVPPDDHLFAAWDDVVPTSFAHDGSARFDKLSPPEHGSVEPGASDFAGDLPWHQSGTSQAGGAHPFPMPSDDNFFHCMLPPATPRDGLMGADGPHEAPPESGNGQGGQRQQLAELSMKLDCQVAIYGSCSAQGRANGADAYPEDLAGAVVESSFAFLDLLSTFKASLSHHPNTIHTVIRASTHHCLPCPSTSTSPDQSTESLAPPSRLAPPHHHHHHHHHHQPAKVHLVNLTTSLQLLACYMHLLHLHSILYTATHTYVAAQSHRASTATTAATAARSAHPRPLFPTLHVHGVPLTRPSTYKFHIQLLLQISLDTLGRIESALGLPQGYGVRQGAGGAGGDAETRSGGGDGLLEAGVSSQLVAVVMHEEGAMGCERIREIRETVAALRSELKGEVDF